MTRGLSIYLDALRVIAAVFVVASHWAYGRFTGPDHNWIRSHDLGADGVIIFFVLSGLVIHFTAERRRADGLLGFAVDRLSRLWSVAIPALLLTLFADKVGPVLDPAVYTKTFHGLQNDAPPILNALTFTNEVWFRSVRVGSNTPWWSLSYEAFYYAIFGCAFYLKGWRRGLGVALILALCGPRIWMLLPAWLAGVGVWHLVRAGYPAGWSRPVLTVLMIGPVLAYIMAHLMGLHTILFALTEGLVGENLFRALDFSDTVLWSTLLSLLVSLHILGVAGLSAKRDFSGTGISSVVRWCACGTFSLYLVHYPIMHLVAAILPGEVGHIGRQAAIFLLPIIFAYGFAELTERRAGRFRLYLRKVAQGVRLRVA